MKKRGDRDGLFSAAEVLTESSLNKGMELIPAPKDDEPRPIPTAADNPQLNLFRDFLCNKEEEREKLSNAIDLWDSVPRYSVSKQAMNRARDRGGDLENYTVTFQYGGNTFTCTIYPARITDFDGKKRSFYPSANEELVEDALRKIALEQQAGFFDKVNYKSGVRCSLYAVREELAKRGHARSYQEVRQSIDIMSQSICEISGRNYKGEEILVRSPYLPSIAAVSKRRLKDDPEAKWVIHFHPFVTGSIDKVTYRQFNYQLMMGHSSQLARWLHKYLVLKYTFAEHAKPFEIRYSTIKRDSGLLSGYSRERDAMSMLESALKELSARGIVASFDRSNITGTRQKLEDVVFTLWPSADFVKEVKAANKRLLLAQQKDPVGLGRGSGRDAGGIGRGSR